MKRFVIHIFSVLAFLVFCSKSCETPEDQQSGREEALLAATLDSINSSLSADQPSDKTLRLLEIKAGQKLSDLADYLQVYFTDSLDEVFRDQSAKMIRDLFIPDSLFASLNLVPGHGERYSSIHDLLNPQQESQWIVRGFTFDSIHVLEPLRKTNDKCYKGTLGFITRSSSFNSENYFQQIKEASIIAAKTVNPFGSDTLKVWSVFIENISR